MSAMRSQITGVSIVYSAICSGADQRKYQSSTLLTSVRGIHRWPVKSPHKGSVTWKMFQLDDVIMYHSIRTHWDMGAYFVENWPCKGPDSKVHGTSVGLSWVPSAPDGPHVGSMNLVIRAEVLSRSKFYVHLTGYENLYYCWCIHVDRPDMMTSWYKNAFCTSCPLGESHNFGDLKRRKAHIMSLSWKLGLKLCQNSRNRSRNRIKHWFYS